MATLHKQIEVVLNLGNYQSVRLTSGLTMDVDEQLTTEQRTAAEKNMTEEVARDVGASLYRSVEILSKKPDAPEAFAAACRDKVAAATAPAPKPAAAAV